MSYVYPLSISWTETILGFSGQIKEETFEEVLGIFAFKNNLT